MHFVDSDLSHIYNVVMEELRFEWDERKNKENQLKHDVSFEEARTVFYDDEHAEWEDRFLLLGISAKSRVLMICHCLREDGDVIRIISARKATRTERKQYPWRGE